MYNTLECITNCSKTEENIREPKDTQWLSSFRLILYVFSFSIITCLTVSRNLFLNRVQPFRSFFYVFRCFSLFFLGFPMNSLDFLGKPTKTSGNLMQSPLLGFFEVVHGKLKVLGWIGRSGQTSRWSRPIRVPIRLQDASKWADCPGKHEYHSYGNLYLRLCMFFPFKVFGGVIGLYQGFLRLSMALFLLPFNDFLEFCVVFLRCLGLGGDFGYKYQISYGQIPKQPNSSNVRNGPFCVFHLLFSSFSENPKVIWWFLRKKCKNDLKTEGNITIWAKHDRENDENPKEIYRFQHSMK